MKIYSRIRWRESFLSVTSNFRVIFLWCTVIKILTHWMPFVCHTRQQHFINKPKPAYTMAINVTLSVKNKTDNCKPVDKDWASRLPGRARRIRTGRGVGGWGKLLLVWQETEKLSHRTSRTRDILTQAQSPFSVWEPHFPALLQAQPAGKPLYFSV